MSVKNYLYLLVAASAVGKSALLRKMREENLWKAVPKYSTRDVRDGEDDDIVAIDDKLIKNSSHKDSLQIRHGRINLMKDMCYDGKGVVYYKNNNLYAITIKDILEILKTSNAVAIMSDFSAIEKLKKHSELTGKIKVLYIASTIDERALLERYKSRESISFDKNAEETKKAIYEISNLCSVLGSAARLNYLNKIEEVMPLLNEEWNNILPYFETIKTRAANIRMLYNLYISNIHSIDYPILNFHDLDYMYSQARSIIKSKKVIRKIQYPPVFMVCAAPSSGKAQLMEIVGDLGEINGNIKITSKYAKRPRREDTDGRDGMIAIGKDGDFSDYIKNKNDIWKWEFHGNGSSTSGTQYAVDRSEIEKNIENKMPQIFISNMGQIKQALEYYPNNVVVLYLHATHETETRNHIEAKRFHDKLQEIMEKQGCSKDEAETRLSNSQVLLEELNKKIEADLKEIEDVHKKFLDYNTQIDHVLLNTGTREDLVSQMVNLLDYYGDLV